MTKLIKKFLRGGTTDETYRASYSLPTININSGRTSENFQRALNARGSEFYQNLIRRVAMNRATNIDYKWLRDNGITSDELNKDVAAHQLNIIDPIRELQYQRKINNELQIKRILNREDYEGLRKGMTIAAAAPFALSVAGPALGAYGEALKEAPLLTIGQTVGNIGAGMVGGATVNKVTGGWGNWLGLKLGVPEESKVLDYTNPGYFIGLPVNRIATIAGRLFDRLPMLPSGALSRVAVTPEGVQVPVSSGNNRTMNSIRSWIHNKTAPKSTPKAPEPSTTQTLPNDELDNVLADVRYRENRNKPVKVIRKETGYTLDDKPIDPNKLTYEEYLPNAHIDGKWRVVEERNTVIPGTPGQAGYYVDELGNRYYGEQSPIKFGIRLNVKKVDAVPEVPETTTTQYFYKGEPVDGNVFHSGDKWFKDAGEWRNANDIKEVVTKTRVKRGEQIPEDALVLDYSGKEHPITGEEIFRTAPSDKWWKGHFRNSFVDINGNVIRGLKNPGTQRAIGLAVGLTTGLGTGIGRYGLKKAYRLTQWTPDLKKQTDTIPQTNTTQDSTDYMDADELIKLNANDTTSILH